MERAHCGDWVEITQTLLKPGERSQSIPPDTAAVPLIMRIRGFAQHEAEVHEQIAIKTLSGRIVAGSLLQINPHYTHSFGQTVPILMAIKKQLKNIE